MEKIRLLLAYPEIEYSATATHTYALPLGLGSIATYCRDKLQDSLEIKMLDSSLIGQREQLEEVRKFMPDVTGINSTIGSQRNAYELAKLAKDLGSLVIFGGVNSTNLWKSMLKNRNFIDGVVLYEGEVPMFFILNRLKEQKVLGTDCFEGIPNLAFKDSRGQIHPPSKIHVLCLSDILDIDYSLFDLVRFFEQTESKGFGKAITYYAGKGCAKRSAMKLKEVYSLEEYIALVTAMDVCTFCGRNELGLRNFEQDREARIVRGLHEKYGIKLFFNVQDSVNLRNKLPIGLDDSIFRLFIGIEQVTPSNIRRLKQRYGSHLIFQAGIESAIPQMRRVYGKKVTDLKEIMSKVKLMDNEGVQLHPSFILGGRGETEDSMKQNTEMARKLVEYKNVTWILVSPQLILPGSPDYRALLQLPKMATKYANQDLIDIPEISRDFLSQFTPRLTRELIIEEIKNTFEDIRNKGNAEIPILDVKGVTLKEEDYIKPSRPYATK